MKQKAIICDIDGVLLDTEHIFERIETAQLTGRDKWDYFNRHANEHDVVADSRVIEILEAFSERGFRIIFLTARMNEIESETKAKIDASIGLYAEKIFPYLILTRPTKNVEPSNKVKEVWVELLREKYDIFCAIDDDPENCEMFAKQNILTMQVHKKRG